MKLRTFASLAALALSGTGVSLAQEVSLGTPTPRLRPAVVRAANPETVTTVYTGPASSPTVMTTEGEIRLPRSTTVTSKAPKVIASGGPNEIHLPRQTSYGGPILQVQDGVLPPTRPMPLPGGGMSGQPQPMPAGPSNYSPSAPVIIHEGHPYEGGAILDGNNGACFDNACRPRIWGSVDYLLLFSKRANTPPLVTSSPAGTPIPASGVLGLPGTSVLLGGSAGDLSYGGISGLRATLGFWLPGQQDVLGFEATGFATEDKLQSYQFRSNANGSPILARPFVSVANGQENSLLVTSDLPGLVGGVDTTLNLRVWGAEGNTLVNLGDLAYSRNTLLLGVRYFDLHETLTMTQTSYLPLVDQGSLISDAFSARTQFAGAQIGLRKSFNLTDRLTAEMTGKIALGVSHHNVGIRGTTTAFTSNGPFQVARGGLLALQSNMGTTTRNDFGFLPELELKLGYRVTDNLTVFAGGNFMYLSNVVRAGDQIDRNIDLRNLPSSVQFNPNANAAAPVRRVVDTDYWLTGGNFGMQLKY